MSRLALIAGEGQLPLMAARNAIAQGYTVVPYTLTRANRRALEALCQRPAVPILPGLLNHTRQALLGEQISDLIFVGKVNKWILLKNPVLDSLALELMRELFPRNDDGVMLTLIRRLEAEGIRVLPQADFLTPLLLGPGLYSQTPLTPEQQADVQFGFTVAKEMGRVDIGQTVVVRQGMVLAVEAIEGTDACLRRSKTWGKGGVVVKVAKPNQDRRFDMPTVGLRTLKAMRHSRLSVLAFEAHQTMVLDLPEMQRYANRHGLVIVGISH
jgi:DUF1009 family protein